MYFLKIKPFLVCFLNFKTNFIYILIDKKFDVRHSLKTSTQQAKSKNSMCDNIC